MGVRKKKVRGNGCLGDEKERDKKGGREQKDGLDKRSKQINNKPRQLPTNEKGKEEVDGEKDKVTGGGAEEGEKEDKTNKNLLATMFSSFMKRRDSQAFHASL